MATMILQAVGSLLGPIGGAIGAVVGRTIDGAIMGGGKHEGPRLKELKVTTSSYGQPIARHHGRMRAAGTIIWATDLVEHKDTKGGKKGQPSYTSYSYTTSFAVALSSRPILAVGRIWADGNLLRGEAGDLKAAGAIRVHTGHGDQAPDPLISATEGEAMCPAFRDCAYIVFEDLALGDFGNRIPALTFEIVADEGAVSLGDLVDPLGAPAQASGVLAQVAGFANEGGPLASTLAAVDTLIPLSCDAGGERLTIMPVSPADHGEVPVLPDSVRGWDEGDEASPRPDDDRGERRQRDDALRVRPDALRYYDVARDYQPGVQRPAGRSAPGRTATIEFPGALAADDARALADEAARRSGWRRDTVRWRVAALDPAHAPGSRVRIPGRTGIWRIEGWEWRSRGVELELTRMSPRPLASPAGDAGTLPPPADLAPAPTALMVFEAPPAGSEPGGAVRFAAASARGPGSWAGAALFLDRAGELVSLGGTGRERATMGVLAIALGSASAMLFEPSGALEIDLTDPSGDFAEASLVALSAGANRLLVGGEVIQFSAAEELAAGRWRLSGLLRGRGGTEPAAFAGHPSGTPAVLLDSALIALDPALVPGDAGTMLAAIGAGDAEPVYATLANPGLGSRPPSPVHPRAQASMEEGLSLAWTRRARGAWSWADEVDVPLVEDTESYRVGLGPVAAPIAQWLVAEPRLIIPAAEYSALAAAHPGADVWVRQIGRSAQSDALFLHTLR